MANRYVLALATGLTGFYIYDVQMNHGRQIEQFGLYNWNPPVRVDPSLAQQTANSFNAGLAKADGAKSSATSWIGDKNQQVQDSLGAAQSQVLSQLGASKEKVGSFFSNSQEVAEAQYAAASDKLKEAQKKYDSEKKGWLQWGGTKGSEAEAELQKAKRDFESASQSLSKWGDDVLKAARAKSHETSADIRKKSDDFVGDVKHKSYQVGQALKDRKDAVLHDLKRPLSDDDFAKQAAMSVSGWGEQASTIARDEYEAMFDKKGKLALKSQESAEKVSAYYEEQAKLAKKRYEDTKSSWLRWRSAKPKEVQDAAQKEYDNLAARQKESKDSLNYHIEKAKKDAKAAGANSVDKTKAGLDEGNKQAQGYLSRLSNWFRG